MVSALLSCPVKLGARAYLAALPALLRQREVLLFRDVYITDCLKTALENTAVPAAYFSEGKAGKFLEKRWIDIVEGEREPEAEKEETRTQEEIAAMIRGTLEKLRG